MINTAIIREGATRFMAKGNDTGTSRRGCCDTRRVDAVPRDVAARPDDLPIGLMITGRHFDDLAGLQIADAVEKPGDWADFRSDQPSTSRSR